MTIFDGISSDGKIRPVRPESVKSKAKVEGASFGDLLKTQAPDKVHLSGKAKEIGELTGMIDSMPEVREAKVDIIRNSIADGSYKPDSKEIAGKILDEVV